MPVAAFIIVVMGLLAAGLVQVGSSTAVAGAQEQISVQALYSAESGAQWGMNQLFYDTSTPISRTSADAACGSISGTTLSFTAPGMNGCDTTVTCQVSVDGGNTTSFYQISSAGSCGVGNVTAQRTVQVSAYLQ